MNELPGASSPQLETALENRVTKGRPAPPITPLAITSVIGAAGMMAHNLWEFGPALLVSPETLIPVAIFGIVPLVTWKRPHDVVASSALLGWALLNLIGGGLLSVLPLGLFPFTPDQSLGHYGAHVVYAVAQIPLAVVAVRAIRSRRRPPTSEDAA